MFVANYRTFSLMPNEYQGRCDSFLSFSRAAFVCGRHRLRFRRRILNSIPTVQGHAQTTLAVSSEFCYAILHTVQVIPHTASVYTYISSVEQPKVSYTLEDI